MIATLFILLLFATIIAIACGVDASHAIKFALDVGNNTGGGALPGAAGAGGSGWAYCPNSPMGNMPENQRNDVGNYCNDLQDTIDRGFKHGQDGWGGVDDFFKNCFDKGWRSTDMSQNDSFVRPYSGQSLLNSCEIIK